MKATRAARLAQVKFVALPLAAATAPAAPRPGRLAAFLRSLFRVIGRLEAARP